MTSAGCRFIAQQMPSTLAQARSGLLNGMAMDPVLAGDLVHVLEICIERVRAIRTESKAVPVAGNLGVNGYAYAPPGKPMTTGAALGQRADKQNDKKCDTPNAPRRDGTRPARQDRRRPARQDGSRHPSMLLGGLLCASGICNFKHNGPCWRRPRDGGDPAEAYVCQDPEPDRDGAQGECQEEDHHVPASMPLHRHGVHPIFFASQAYRGRPRRLYQRGQHRYGQSREFCFKISRVK